MNVTKKTIGKQFDIIRHPVNTEESNRVLSVNNAYTFIVDVKADKPMIKRAIESIFDVKVVSVNTLIRKGKRKVFKGRIGKRSDTKRAIVRLEPGNKIELGMGV